MKKRGHAMIRDNSEELNFFDGLINNANLFNRPTILDETDIEDFFKNLRYSDDKATLTFYTVKRGDTLTKIAKQYGTTVEKIMQLNKEINNKNKIKVGQRLRLEVGA